VLFEEIGDIQEGILLDADVHEGRLHARQHLAHLALVNVADEAAVLSPLDVVLHQLVVLQDGHMHLEGGDVHHHLSVHESPQQEHGMGGNPAGFACGAGGYPHEPGQA
jgi:hypothetical protein